MRYFEPTAIDEVVGLLAADDGARCLAGGATLVAMMNAGLAAPSALVSLRKVEGLAAIVPAPGGGVTIGAMATHAAVAASPLLVGGNALVREAAGQIAHPAIRTMGTLGGALAHADPSADYPCAVLAAGADIHLAGPAGQRVVAAGEFFLDYMTTVLEPGEIVTAVTLPPTAPDEASAYLKFSRVDGDYATACIGVRLAMDGGVCRAFRLAVGGCGPVPIHLADADAALLGGPLSADAVARLAEAYVAAADPVDDFRGTAEFRTLILPGLIERSIGRALAKLETVTA